MHRARRTFFLGVPAALLLASPEPSFADTTATYQYDALGRLVRVTFSDGRFVSYEYDALGNRREVIRSDNSTFTATLQITGTAPVNLRSLANANGYTGAQHANITYQLASNVTITGQGGPGAGGVAIDTGAWSSSVLAISLALQVNGVVRGGGGGGGGGAGSSAGFPGGVGGDAIYCRENISITVNTGGEVRAGGGGGGGGQSWWRVNPDIDEPFYYNGGGGGGGFPNGPGGPEGTGDAEVSNPGAAGTASGGGAGGTGGGSAPGGAARINGAGGNGGGAGQAGALGNPASGTSTGPARWEWASNNSGQGGAAGYAIRKNGKTVTVVNNGAISGTVG